MTASFSPLPGKRRLAMLRSLLQDALASSSSTPVSTFDPAHLRGVQGRLEFVRDRNGVAHLYASVEADLYRALGYLQGRERLVVIEALRHLAAGRLSEFLVNVRIPAGVEKFGGFRVGEFDAFLRPLGFEAEAERDYGRLNGPARACLDAFAEGMNAALAAYEGRYPAEFLAIGEVRPWHGRDCLLLARACALVIALMPLENELTFDNVRTQEGDAIARILFPEAPWDQAPDLAPGGGAVMPEGPFDPPAMGSNNWAVAGSRTASGKPLLCNDPHVPLVPAPTFWHHVHLECPAYRVQGGLYPGFPGMGWGHNGHIAWGVTTAFRDAWDIVRIRRLPGDPSRYFTDTGTGSITRHREPHRSRLGKTRWLEWERCEHGVIYSHWRRPDGTDLALQVAEADGAEHFDGHRALFAARSVGETQAALAQMNRGPFDFNLVYAHKDGHIAWEQIGQLPRRNKDGLFIRDARDPDARWHGYLDFSENPKIINPENGVVVTANSDTDPHQFQKIGTRIHCEPRYRQQRVTDLLLQSNRHDLASMQAMQRDVHSYYGLQLKEPLCVALQGDELSAQEKTALTYLRNWDGQFGTDSVGACIFFFTRQQLCLNLFKAVLGKESAKRFAHGQRAIPRLDAMLLDEADSLRQLLMLRTGETLNTWIVRSYRQALRRIRKVAGSDPAGWQWGELHRVRIGTVLGDVPGLGKRWLAMEAPFPGDANTISPSVAIPFGGRLRAFVGASTRFICDLDRPDEAWFAHCAGPSADPDSPYYRSLPEQWLRFEYFRSALWPADAVPEVIERHVMGE